MKALATTSSKHSGRDAYLSLIHRFPLRPVRNDREHGRATEIIGELLGRKLDRGTGDYLDTLILLVNKYEDDRHTVSAELTPQQAVRAIMQANGLTQKEVGKLIGSEPALSMFLKGERQLSKSHIRALAERFRIDPLIFF
jgi:antitoxin component HigA of HigAB toxin-antitoxin module